jgi:hypothetical protein
MLNPEFYNVYRIGFSYEEILEFEKSKNVCNRV